jgi:deoxyribodipyrimidine photo-lyase
MGSTSIAWLRNDLRIADNPALSAAVKAGQTVVAVYIHETTGGVRPPGAAARWWLHRSLGALGAALAERGIELVVRAGDARIVVPGLVAEREASAVFWNRRYAPGERDADTAIMAQLKYDGIAAQSFAGNLLIEPWEIATGEGKPYSVFTPFWKRLREMSISAPQRRPASGEAIAYQPADTGYGAPSWSQKLANHWTIGEAAAHERLVSFLDDQLDD